MSLTRQSLEMALDLVEIKLAALEVQDKDDARELTRLRRCRQELASELSSLQTRKNVSLDRLGREARISQGRRKTLIKH